jgi:hypothetical protein
MPKGYRLTIGYRLITVEHGIANWRWGYKPITRWHHLAAAGMSWILCVIATVAYLLNIYNILTCKMTFYQAYILTYYLASSLRFCFDHISYLRAIWHILYSDMLSCILSELAFLSAYLTYTVFCHFMWNSIWHFIWHSNSHSFTSYLTFFLSFCLIFYLAFCWTCYLKIYFEILLRFILHFIWHMFWHSICRNIKPNKTMIGFSGPWLLLTTVMKKSDKWVPQVSNSLDHEFVVHFSIPAKNLPMYLHPLFNRNP